MLKHHRQRTIQEYLTKMGAATVLELARELHTSDDTIRRDLHELAKSGSIMKTHGGAVSTQIAQLPRAQRSTLHNKEKVAIALSALFHIKPGMSLILDAGTTLLALAEQLPCVPLTVITHSLDIANYLAHREEIKLIVAGGEWDASQRLFKGDSAVTQIQAYRADLLFMGACAVHPQLGVTASEAGDAAIKRAMLLVSQSAILLADQTKCNATAPHAIAPLSRFSHWHSDRAPAWLLPEPSPALIITAPI